MGGWGEDVQQMEKPQNGNITVKLKGYSITQFCVGVTPNVTDRHRGVREYEKGQKIITYFVNDFQSLLKHKLLLIWPLCVF